MFTNRRNGKKTLQMRWVNCFNIVEPTTHKYMQRQTTEYENRMFLHSFAVNLPGLWATITNTNTNTSCGLMNYTFWSFFLLKWKNRFRWWNAQVEMKEREKNNALEWVVWGSILDILVLKWSIGAVSIGPWICNEAASIVRWLEQLLLYKLIKGNG